MATTQNFYKIKHGLEVPSQDKIQVTTNTGPTIRPSLLLDFANSKQLDPRIDFTRASTGTYYDGKTVAKAEENLLLYSQEFDNEAWSQNNRVTANTITAPDGTTTADTLSETASGTASVRVSRDLSGISGLAYSASIYVQDNTSGRYFYISLATQTGSAVSYRNIIIDLSDGSITEETTGSVNNGAAPSLISSGVETIGSWYRIKLSVTANQTGILVPFFGLSDSGTPSKDVYGRVSYTQNSKSCYIWGAQLEQRNTVTAYTLTTDQPITNYVPVLQTASANTARFDYDPVTGESLGLLVEEQRTNLVTYSEQFDNSAWIKERTSIISNTIVAPDGTLTGDKLVSDGTAGDNHRIGRSPSITTTAPHTLSVYAKAGELSQIALYMVVNSIYASIAYFDLLTGQFMSTTGSSPGFDPVYQINNVGNGWYKFSISTNYSVTSINTVRIYSAVSGNVIFDGDGYSGIYIWGAQLEAGAFPTSYIKTEASQVTRSADSAIMTETNFSEWYRQDEGTLFGIAKSSVIGAAIGIVALSDNTASNRMHWRFWIDQHMRTYVNGVQQHVGNAGNFVANTFSSFVGAYKVNDFGMVIDSGPVNLETSSLVPRVNRLIIGSGDWNGDSSILNGHIKKIAYYPARLPNETLQAITSS